MAADKRIKSEKSEELPHGGAWYVPENQVSPISIVFVHHFGGHRSSVKAHQQLVGKLGYPSVSFNQSFHSRKSSQLKGVRLPLVLHGLRHIWAQEITEVLNAIEGKKIMFSFSFPSSAALEAIALRGGRDICGWICDGGPFLKNQICFWNYFQHQLPIKNWLFREAAVLGSRTLFGTWNLKSDFKTYFQKLPNRFPVLSVRGWQDPLVPPSAIDEVFSLSNNLEYEVLSLPQGHHLDGIRVDPETYELRVKNFLERAGSRVF